METAFSKRGVSTDLTKAVIHGLTMPGDPDLPWGEIERRKVGRNTASKKTGEL